MKVALVLSDGLRDDIAAERMGFLEHLIETGQGTRYHVQGELPTLSRPMYETVHTGLPVTQHGIYSNQIVRRSSVPNVFEVAVQNGRTTGAAAYYWFSELYNRVPYDLVDDREVDDPSLLIQHGRFYTEDSYPDKELFLAAATLVRRFSPDYLLVHPMGMDHLGDTLGADTSGYRNNAIVQDIILANLIPEWHERGYTVLVTADHGMGADRSHGGTTPDVRMVPMYLLPPAGGGRGNTGETISQLQVAPTVLSLMGLPIPTTMKHPAVP
jgi:predicted AlkP superfamily pyrophosphatase or phosphodiesterase